MSAFLNIISTKEDSSERIKLSQEDYVRVDDCLKEMSVLMSEIDYCLMLRQNATELMEEILYGSRSHDSVFNELNRKLMNLLNSFYAWIEFHESNYKDLFSRLKTKYYNDNFEYRLAYSLRKYTTHCSVCISRITYDVLSEVECIQIVPKELLDNSSYLNAIIKKDLQELEANGEAIDLRLLLSKFLLVFEQFQDELWKQLIPKIGEKADRLRFITELLHDDRFIDIILEPENGDSKSVVAVMLQFYEKIKSIKPPKE